MVLYIKLNVMNLRF